MLDQQYRIESPEINPYTYLRQRRQEYTMEKRQSLQQVAGKSWTAICKSMKLEQSLTLYIKINSKWFKDQNIQNDTIKFLEENTDKTFSDINLSVYS